MESDPSGKKSSPLTTKMNSSQTDGVWGGVQFCSCDLSTFVVSGLFSGTENEGPVPVLKVGYTK